MQSLFSCFFWDISVPTTCFSTQRRVSSWSSCAHISQTEAGSMFPLQPHWVLHELTSLTTIGHFFAACFLASSLFQWSIFVNCHWEIRTSHNYKLCDFNNGCSSELQKQWCDWSLWCLPVIYILMYVEELAISP
jgi:hypothetical protein